METALEIAAAVRRREVSAVEVTTAALERAERVGPVVGAFAEVTPELALGQARAVDEAVAGGGGGVDAANLPLAGVPLPVKDLNQVAGVPLRAGSRVLAAQPLVPEVDDGTVTRLREAGTSMIGKTATPEFGFPPYTEPRTGPGGEIVAARTPWDLRRGAGGSSGGAAAAVAAGIVSVAHASDGGGPSGSRPRAAGSSGSSRRAVSSAPGRGAWRATGSRRRAWSRARCSTRRSRSGCWPTGGRGTRRGPNRGIFSRRPVQARRATSRAACAWEC
ncbi:hypothetical protein GCM10025875_00970 [Litorihabitans aurantiacus]|uniref:Amidase domain-containing protein n=1 Tax=Litorihabitans aurantiacus TaxID=1930061 RepID=A0AA37XCN0_9MICO|nr:hypothetical protein GCM10025875_00970 [Litorihabitans aurantiacus]